MTKNPIKIEKNTLATKALSIMNEKKLRVYAFITKIKSPLLLVLFMSIIF